MGEYANTLMYMYSTNTHALTYLDTNTTKREKGIRIERTSEFWIIDLFHIYVEVGEILILETQ